MNALTTECFFAQRQPNGDVWITSRNRMGWKTKAYIDGVIPSALLDGFTIVISQSKCKELAQLLWPNVESDEEEWVGNYNQPYKVDYTRCADEPE